MTGKNKNSFRHNIKGIIRDFDALPLDETIKKPRVGIVGEIMVKFSPSANNYLVDLLEAEGAEAVMPDLLDFFYYSFYNSFFKVDKLGKPRKSKAVANIGITFMNMIRKTAADELKKSKRFSPPSDIRHLAKAAQDVVSLGNQTGEGWFLTGEMLELIEEGAPNIVCTQPFGCLPNHIVGKGVIRRLRELYPDANIFPIDYDAGASKVNQENRIKLMLSVAREEVEHK
jgi:predicted nucleotide-binding protein (sugar kinase/HSP70/actin superfamily)